MNDLKTQVICSACNEIVYDGNFCTLCGNKLNEQCNCWVLNKKFNCNEAKCPGYSILLKNRRNKPNDKN